MCNTTSCLRLSIPFRMRFAKLCHRCVLINNIGRITTVRDSSQFRRSPLSTKNDQLAEIKQTFFYNRTELSPKEWQNVTDVLLDRYKHINKNNIDAVIVGVCRDSHQLSLANSFVRYLESLGKIPNDATLGNLLKIYNGVYHARGGWENSLTTQEQNIVLEICDKIRTKHDILDFMSCENLILGLVCTKKWREGMQLLEMMKVTAAPTLAALTELASKAFRMQDTALGWILLQAILELRKQPKCEVFLDYLKTTSNYTQTFSAELEKMLEFLGKYDVVITEKVAKALIQIADSSPSLLTVSMVKLKRHGKCGYCDQFLENISISDEDFKMLRSSFLEKVLMRNDVFQRSTPEEVEHFREYVNRTGPFDCVVDGLNVAYSAGAKKPQQTFANLLANVVKYLTAQNKHVLVLGRKHMNSWPEKTMRYVKNNAAMFLANDLSHDDPFLLYATLLSGQTTDFFSRDLMRQHAFLLGPDLRTKFRRWQQEHQYSLICQTENGKIIVKEPIRHLICAHKVGSHWHVPYKQEYSQHLTDSFDVPEHWLCIKLSPQ